jgi:hypothetical protein
VLTPSLHSDKGHQHHHCSLVHTIWCWTAMMCICPSKSTSLCACPMRSVSHTMSQTCVYVCAVKHASRSGPPSTLTTQVITTKAVSQVCPGKPHIGGHGCNMHHPHPGPNISPDNTPQRERERPTHGQVMKTSGRRVGSGEGLIVSGPYHGKPLIMQRCMIQATHQGTAPVPTHWSAL